MLSNPVYLIFTDTTWNDCRYGAKSFFGQASSEEEACNVCRELLKSSDNSFDIANVLKIENETFTFVIEFYVNHKYKVVNGKVEWVKYIMVETSDSTWDEDFNEA